MPQIMVKSPIFQFSPIILAPQWHHGGHMAGRRAVGDELRAGALRPGLGAGALRRAPPGGGGHPGSHFAVRLGWMDGWR